MSLTVAPKPRLTPALSGQGERDWSLPDLNTRETWLSEARTVYHANKDRRAADGWMKAHNAARTIRLIGLVDDLDARVASQAEDAAALRKTRNQQQAEITRLKAALKESQAREAQANVQIDQLIAQRNALQESLRAYKIGLDALGEAYLKVKEEVNG